MSGQYQEAHKDGNRLHDKIQAVLAMIKLQQDLCLYL